MHIIQQKILSLSKNQDIGKLSLRQIASIIEEVCSPQKIKHHIEQLKKKWLLIEDKMKWAIEAIQSWLNKAWLMFSIPILGSANCGEAVNFIDDWSIEWYLQISKSFLNLNRESNIFALKAIWHSMNKSKIWGLKQSIDDWDYVIIDSNPFEAKTWDIIVSIIDWCANIKKLIKDHENNQIVLIAESSIDFPPIFIHENDNYTINWKVIQVIKRPKMNN